MGLSLERRFERYCDGIVSVLVHVNREQSAQWTMKGLMLPGKRKSIEPIAVWVQPGNVRSAYQSMINEQGGWYFRVIGLARTATKIGLMNLMYNMRRLVQIDKLRASGV